MSDSHHPIHKFKKRPGACAETSKAVSVLDLVVLLGNVYRGAADADVGYEDTEQSFNELLVHLNKFVSIPRTAFESALWSANLLNETGKFWCPKGRSFEEFLKHVCRGEEFDLDYNLLENTPR